MAFIDNLFEILIPILILWGATKDFSKSKKKRKPVSQEQARQVVDIREEIQRKIHERRAANAREVREESPLKEATVAARKPSAVAKERVAPREEVEVFDESHSTSAKQTDWKAIEKKIAKQNEQVASLRQGLSNRPISKSDPAVAHKQVVVPCYSIHAQLRDPAKLRQAFVMQEILSTPIALRENNKVGPLWGA